MPFPPTRHFVSTRTDEEFGEPATLSDWFLLIVIPLALLACIGLLVYVLLSG